MFNIKVFENGIYVRTKTLIISGIHRCINAIVVFPKIKYGIKPDMEIRVNKNKGVFL